MIINDLFNNKKQDVAEGRFVRGPGGVPLDRQGRPVAPKAPKAEPMRMRQWVVHHEGQRGEGGEMIIDAPNFETAWELANEYDLDIIDIKPVKGVAEGSKMARADKSAKAPKPEDQQEYNDIEKYRKDLAQSYNKEPNFGIKDDEEENKWWIDYDLDEGVAEAYQFKGGFPFDVDHMNGPRGINLPSVETKKYFTDKQQWAQAVDELNHSLYDDNSMFTGVTGRSTVAIDGREWARWSDAQQKGYVETKSLSQGMAEGSLEEVSQQTLQSYRKKASAQKRAADDVVSGDADDKTWKKNVSLSAKRRQGIDAANKRLGVAEGSLEEDKGMKQYWAFKREWRAKHGANARVPSYDSKEYNAYCWRQGDKQQGVAEGSFDHWSPMGKDSIHQDRIRSLQNLIAIAKEQGRQLRVQELELALKKLQGVNEVSLGDYRKKAAVSQAGAKIDQFFGRDDAAKVAAADQTIAKRERGLARADARTKPYTPPAAAPADLEKQQRDLTAKYPNIDELVRRAELNRDPDYEMADGQAYYAARDAEQNYLKLKQIQRVIQGLNESLQKLHRVDEREIDQNDQAGSAKFDLLGKPYANTQSMSYREKRTADRNARQSMPEPSAPQAQPSGTDLTQPQKDYIASIGTDQSADLGQQEPTGQEVVPSRSPEQIRKWRRQWAAAAAQKNMADNPAPATPLSPEQIRKAKQAAAVAQFPKA
jgi:hypothetical protein